MRPQSLLRFFLSALLLSFPAGVHAQTSTAQITGRVSDPSDANVSGAEVQVTNVNTGATRTATTSTAGYYTVPLLDAGRYDVSVQVAGFKPMSRTGVTLQVDQVARIDFALELGGSSEKVLVTAEAPLLDAATSSLGQVVENRQITELPTNGRNTLAFVELTPGITVHPGIVANPFTIATNSRGNFAANGGIANANEILVDGAPVTLARSNAPGFLPPLDATQEFRVETNSYSAEFGRSSGAVINLSIKSGTNALHGTVYEFLRNSNMDANSFFQNAAGLPNLPLRQNQYGVSAGAPVRRDKTFFFVNFEGFNQRQSANFTTTVPTIAQRAGDFSQTFNAAGQLVQIADPTTTQPGPNGTYSRTVFSGNRIPGNRIDPIAAKFTNFFWPLPNQPGTGPTGINNYSTSASQPYDAYQGIGRFDHTLNSKWKFFATYAQQRISHGMQDFFHNQVSVSANSYVDNTTTHNAVLAATAVFSPRWIGEFRSAFIRLGQDRIPPTVPFDLTSMGFPSSLYNAESFKTFPVMSIAGVTSVNSIASTITLQRTNNWTESGSMTWVHGGHTTKFGGEYRLMQLNDVNSTSSSPTLNFTTQFTAINPLSLNASSGIAMASFLLGYPASGTIAVAQPLADQRWYANAFFQDDWKVTRRLTVNLGLQYSLDSSVTERFNRMSWFDPSAVPPIGATVGLPLRGGLRFADNNTRTPEDLYLKQWAPRAGFALQATSNTVVRAAYGIFRLPNNLNFGTTSTRSTFGSASTAFVGTLDSGLTPHDTLSNPFPNGINQAAAPSGGLNSLVGSDLSIYLRSNHPGYMQQWNFNVQQSLWKSIAVQAAYAGSKGTGLPLNVQLNQLAPEYMSLGTALTQQVPNPFFGLVSTGILASRTVARSQLLRPFPQFGDVQALGANAGSSSYHSFQLSATRHFGASVVAVAYTLSKNIGDSESGTPAVDGGQPGGGGIANNYNHRLDRSLVEYDTPQRLVASYTVDLPFGKGRRLLNKTGFADRIVSGWQLTGIYTAQSGTPLYLSTTSNLTNAYVNFSRPNNNGQSAKLDGDAHDRLTRWFNTSVFSQPPAFTFGNVSRTLPDVRNHGTNNLDLGVFKNNRFGHDGRFNLQVRGEFFNVANRVQFANPGMVFGNPQFGVVSAQANTPRQVQIALKFVY